MKKRILCLITAGLGGQDERRAHLLTASLDADVTFYAIDKSLPRGLTSQAILDKLREERWNLVYQEGTGIASGSALLRHGRAHGQRYIVSSGDPISGFFHVTKGIVHGKAFELYERLLYSHCAGFVGWTPYLTGRAIDMGAPRGLTVEGGADLRLFRKFPQPERAKLRTKMGLNQSHIVCGVVGSLHWNPRQSYSYGLELIEMLKLLERPDVSLLIVGDGDGREQLERRLPDSLRKRVVFTGRLQPSEVVEAMNAMDIGFITQTLDNLGNFRLTTKLPEYLACGLPVAMSPVPGFYDYAAAAGWALPAQHPASHKFHQECAAWLDNLQWGEVTRKAALARDIAYQRFDYARLADRFGVFVEELLMQPKHSDLKVLV